MGLFLDIYLNEDVLDEKILYDKPYNTSNISSIKLVDTQHSIHRKGRENQHRRVSDEELSKNISYIESDLIDDWVNGDIPNKGTIHIFNKETHLNIIVRYNFVDNTIDKSLEDGEYRLKLTIITVMIKSNFKPHNVEKTYIFKKDLKNT